MTEASGGRRAFQPSQPPAAPPYPVRRPAAIRRSPRHIASTGL